MLMHWRLDDECDEAVVSCSELEIRWLIDKESACTDVPGGPPGTSTDGTP